MDYQSTMNPELAKARAQGTFDVLKLTHFLTGGPEKTRRKRFLQNMAIKEFQEKGFKRECQLTREEQYEEALRKSTYAFKRTRELGLTDPVENFWFREPLYTVNPLQIHAGAFVPTVERMATEEQRARWLPLIDNLQMIGTYAQTEMGHGRVTFPDESSPFNLHEGMFLPTIEQQATEEQKMRWLSYAENFQLLGTYAQTEMGHDESSPFKLHEGMFIPTIEKQATEEQKTRWLSYAENFQLLGTYAQTEMGHGTFLRGLETTATYDVKTKEFIMDSPTITATKFWPGGLGKTANCCVVMAKLFINGKDCGMQSFMVQIRDLETHQPLPGIEVGDIGPKFGYGSQDNGFLRFNKIRIPRDNMLMRYAQVHEDGTFVRPKNDRLLYGSMTLIRSQIVSGVGRALSKAVTIATRYSAVRKQSKIDASGDEVSVIEFQTQQHKLFPQIATAHALTLAGKAIFQAYTHVSAQIEKGSYDELPVLHALSSGLKAFSSWEMASGVEQCRMACGGHGYNLASGIPKIYMEEVPSCTYEGENTVLCLQTARYLMKCQTAKETGQQLPALVQFMKSSHPGQKSQLDEKLELDHLLQAYQHRTARMIADASSRMKEQLGKGLKQPEAWNRTSQMLVEASLAFSHMFVVKTFMDSIATSGLDPEVAKVMVQLCQLYAATGITKFSGQFTKGGFVSDRQMELVQSRLYDLLSALKPNAVSLVDAFDYPDRVLDSDLGRYDGHVYEALLAYAKNSKLNKTQVHEGFYKYQKPYVDSLRPANTPPAKL